LNGKGGQEKGKNYRSGAKVGKNGRGEWLGTLVSLCREENSELRQSAKRPQIKGKEKEGGGEKKILRSLQAENHMGGPVRRNRRKH